MKVLGLIPARGGSKGVPGKNIKNLNNKPLIAYAIESAKKSKLLDNCIVSTDSEEIKTVAEECGGRVPFLRPKEIAQDATPDFDVIEHALNWFIERGEKYDAVAYLRPTTPLRTASDIDGAIERLQSSSQDIVRSVTRVDGKSHPFWMWKVEDSVAKPFVDGVDIRKYERRQLLPPCYALNGVIDVIRVQLLITGKSLQSNAFTPYEIPQARSYDIDTQSDFEHLESIFARGGAHAEL
jgi:CMP-N-acetylneuraminic acid synthetase